MLPLRVRRSTGKGDVWVSSRWFPIFFLVPTGLHFASACIYSIFFCRLCAYPQPWVIAALPAPFDQWEGAIVGSLFIGKAGEQILAMWRSK